LNETSGKQIEDIWMDVGAENSMSGERTDYPTQKPVSLLERILSTSSNPGDLVADFFCGSGTTLAVAEKLGRKWIGCDLGRFGIHTTRKRMIRVQRELKKANKPYRSFKILNLGKYERQFFAGINPTLPEEQRRAESNRKQTDYLALILGAYKCEPVNQSPPFHGRKGSTLVCVGPIDSAVTRSLVVEAVEAALKLGVNSVDLIGFEFEMGLTPQAVEEARDRGVRLALRYIPKDVFDKRAVDKNQVVFYDVAYVQVETKAKALSLTVTLADFGVSYRQEDADRIAGEMKNKGSKVTVDQGQVVKISKDAKGEVTREVLTKKWTDWIDYWSVDFDYHSKQEIITVTAPDGTGRLVDRPQWTGGNVFENEWQSFRTRRDRNLELTSAAHVYPAKGKYFVAVKVIDIFGNNTTKVVEVVV
jgi:adenine-specific DNA-methyltransferase